MPAGALSIACRVERLLTVAHASQTAASERVVQSTELP
jgi:hypothetical protein